MDLDIYLVDASKLEDAIRSIPAVYPPELSFLSKKPITEAWIVRSMLSSRVYASPAAPFFAFSAKGGHYFLTILVTKDSLASGLGYEDLDLLGELYRSGGKLLTGQVQDAVQVAFPEDDFTTPRPRRWFWARSSGGADDWEQSMKSSGINAECPRLAPFRCGLPKSFCNQLLAKFRRDKTSTTVLGDAIRHLRADKWQQARRAFKAAESSLGLLAPSQQIEVLLGSALCHLARGGNAEAKELLARARFLAVPGTNAAKFVGVLDKASEQDVFAQPLLVPPLGGDILADSVPVEVSFLKHSFLQLVVDSK